MVWDEGGMVVHVFSVVPPGMEYLRIVLLAFEPEQAYPIAVMTITPGHRYGPYVEMVEVNDEYRRRGVATRLWKIAEERLGYRLRGQAVSEGGEGLVRAVERGA